MAVFGVGALSAVLAMLAAATQKGYYQTTRDRKRELENRLGLGDLAIAPTPGMGSLRGRIARITTFQAFMLVALLLADLTGLVTSVIEAFPSRAATPVALAVQMTVARADRRRAIPLVVSDGHRVVLERLTRDGQISLLSLRPGTYRLTGGIGSQCVRDVGVTSAPLQVITLSCTSGRHPAQSSPGDRKVGQ
jgi:hypothetical protein